MDSFFCGEGERGYANKFFLLLLSRQIDRQFFYVELFDDFFFSLVVLLLPAPPLSQREKNIK